jgi:hypothetical protein
MQAAEEDDLQAFDPREELVVHLLGLDDKSVRDKEVDIVQAVVVHHACLSLQEVAHFLTLVDEEVAEHLQATEAAQPRQEVVRSLLLCKVGENKHDVDVVGRPLV